MALKDVRKEGKSVPVKRKVINSALILAFGVFMGLLAKVLDTTGVDSLPEIVARLDITNFLGRFAIWIFIAVCISVYSKSPKRAALNTFLFFLGMVSSYYLYSRFVAGFFPKSYALVWFGITAVSPVLSYISWYAKGNGIIAVAISGVILGVLLAQAVLFLQGVRITHVTEVFVWLMALWVLRRKFKEFAIALFISLMVSIIYQLVIPYWG